ncbi:TetR/AcrR family transcriptional regulator [Saccharopolyspora endophytica]|uniref:TetR/AcrR family transcriptional regulator n=1 Tax=Saccharopolyspora endophytica TaxID=543886 RepID=UPI001FE67616|nr:TetR/AcrR family transcriptional regulator [Saccharopolyspora endophytica]
MLAEGGHEAVSTRAVSAAAGVQAPTIYRLFGDKQGLLDAVTSEAFRIYLDGKAQLHRTDDPVADLRHGWDLHLAFGLAHPALYALMYGAPRTGSPPPAALQAEQVLAEHVHRIAEAVITAITTDAPATSDPGPIAAALALAANLPEDTALSTNEKAMLGEWLDRIAHPTGP